MPPAGPGPLSTMAMSACAAGARCPPGGAWRQCAFTAGISTISRALCACRRRKLRHATPDVFTVSRRTGKEALGQDALTLRFVGSAELQVMVVVQLAPDGGRSCNATGQIAFCTGSIRQVSQNKVRRHASPDRDDPGRRHDRSAVLPRGLGYLRLLRFLAPAGQLGCGRTPAAVEDPGWRLATPTDWLMAVRGPALASVTAARSRAFYPCGLCSCNTGCVA
jgi:hypothetical protein